MYKPQRAPAYTGKKFQVRVPTAKGRSRTVRFGQRGVSIKRNNDKRRRSFLARHRCSTAKDPLTPRYWSCRMWRKGTKLPK